MRIGLLSDTHQPSEQKALWPEIHDVFEGVDLILHAGDIAHPMVLDWCDEIAPTRACRGNNDMGWDDPRIEDIVFMDVEGFRIGMIHDIEPETDPMDRLIARYLKGERVDIFISGHTHLERIDFRDDVLQVNSGSPTLPHLWSTRLGTVGILDITPSRVEARIHRLGETPERRNPGIEYTYTPETGVVQHD
jgi:uncharacterized protein